MQSSTYVSRRPGPFAALIQAADLGGFRLDPVAPVRVRDQYWDTADGELLRSGLALRVRETDTERTASLRPVGDADGGERVPDAALGPDAGGALRLPPGPLADALAARVGVDALRPLLALRQYRTPRVAYDGPRPALLVSLDVVVYEVPGAHVVSNEVEVEVTAQGTDADLGRIDPALRGYDLEPERRTKLERGLLRVSRDLAEPVLLLPDERAALERFAERGGPLVRRRARVLLLDARGYRADTVAGQTGLSAARVRHWKEQFGERRMDIFEPDPAAPAADPVLADPDPADPVLADPAAEPELAAPSYRVRDLVGPPAEPDSAAGDGLAPPEGDLDGLLGEFRPTDTETPIFDSRDTPTGDLDDDDDDLDGGLGNDPDDRLDRSDAGDRPDDRHEAGSTEADLAGGDSAVDDSAGDDVTRRGSAESDSTGDVSAGATPDAALDAAAHVASPETALAAEALRRPALTADTPLLDAAFATLVYHVARFEDAAARLAERPAPNAAPATKADAARRLLIAAHRVRLAVDAFRPFVPAMVAGRLVGALRPLVAALDAALDHDRAADAAPDAAPGTAQAHVSARDAALDRARALLGGGRHRAWGPRARRLLDRLGAQHADGLLIGDDFPAPPDDLVGQPGDVPAPSRLRHAAASMLWARYEALRAFEDDAAAPPTAEAVAHLVLAVSGLHFVLGIAARASTADARALAARLDAAEARLAGVRHRLRSAELGGAVSDGAAERAAVAEVWAEVTSADVRRALADVAAGI